MSFTITQLHGVDNWQMAVACGDVTEGTSEDILRAISQRMNCKVAITEQRVATWPLEGDHYGDDEAAVVAAHLRDQRLIAERNADGRHPIG